MSNSSFCDLKPSENITVEIAKYYCAFHWCNAGPFTEAALFEHLSKHYRRALARKLTECIVKQLREAEKQ